MVYVAGFSRAGEEGDPSSFPRSRASRVVDRFSSPPSPCVSIPTGRPGTRLRSFSPEKYTFSAYPLIDTSA